MIPQRSRLLTPVVLTLCVLFSTLFLASDAEAKSRRRAVSSRAKGKAKVARVARRRARQRATPEVFNEELTASHHIVPDKIEVLENGSERAAELTRLSRPAAASYVPDGVIAPARRRGVSIDAMRVAQIQQALAGRGFYQGEINGAYDELTVSAMQRFQASQRIPTTGYPTAHALKRLGLGSW